MPISSEAPLDPRPYVRMSTDLPLNPKLAAIDDPAASWAYVVSICYAGQSLTDGHFPVAAVIRLAGVDKAVATALAEQELWHLPGHACPRCPQPKPGHAYIHDYLQHQRSADEVRDLTSKRREAGKKGAEKRWAGRKNVAADLPEDAPAGSKPIANAMANAQQELWQNDGKPIAEERRGEENYSAPTERPASRALAVVPDAPLPEPRTTQDLIGYWLDTCAVRPPQQLIGQMSKTIKRLVDEDHIAPEHIRAGIDDWITKDLSPAILPSLVNTAMNRRPAKQRSTRDERVTGWLNLEFPGQEAYA
jgi:hypothetical protein